MFWGAAGAPCSRPSISRRSQPRAVSRAGPGHRAQKNAEFGSKRLHRQILYCARSEKRAPSRLAVQRANFHGTDSLDCAPHLRSHFERAITDGRSTHSRPKNQTNGEAHGPPNRSAGTTPSTHGSVNAARVLWLTLTRQAKKDKGIQSILPVTLCPYSAFVSAPCRHFWSA
jgi:hypothetical protein